MPAQPPQLKRIDFKKGQFDVAGEPMFIQPGLSTSRYVEYLKRTPKLSFATTFRSMYDTLSKIYAAASSGNDMIYAVGQARELSWNQLDAIRRFDENEIPDIIDFVCLFCNRAGEDIGQFDSSIHEAKKAAIAREGYAIEDFFTLAFNLIESFSDGYQQIKSLSEQREQPDPSRSQASQPIKPTF